MGSFIKQECPFSWEGLMSKYNICKYTNDITVNFVELKCILYKRIMRYLNLCCVHVSFACIGDRVLHALVLYLLSEGKLSGFYPFTHGKTSSYSPVIRLPSLHLNASLKYSIFAIALVGVESFSLMAV